MAKKGKKFKRSDRSRPYLNILDFMVQEKTFLAIIIVGIITAGIFTGNKTAAMWLTVFSCRLCHNCKCNAVFNPWGLL